MKAQSETPWYISFFGEDYIRIYSPFLPADKTAQEVADLITLLNIKPGDQILDLCCGYGRHAIPLAQYGCTVTGLDISTDLLQKAREDALVLDASVDWVQSDMQNIPFTATFDSIINIFTSFGYYAHEAANQQVLHQVARALKPGGLFLLETVHQPRVLRATSPHGIIRYPDGLIVLEERHIDIRTSRNEVDISLLYPDGKRVEHHQSIRIYTLTELIQMFTKAGLQIQGYYGGLDQSKLHLDSRLVLIGRKES